MATLRRASTDRWEDEAGSQIAAVGAVAPIAVMPVADHEEPPSPAAPARPSDAAASGRPSAASWSEGPEGALADAPTSTSTTPPAKRRRSLGTWLEGNARYFDTMSILESFVAITSGILVWLGLWDIVTVHMLRDSLAGKLALVSVSIVALFLNRTLYDKGLIELRKAERERRQAGGRNLSLDRVPSTSHVSALVPVPQVLNPSQRAPLRAVDAAATSAPGAAGGSSTAAAPPPAAKQMRRLYFDRPPFNPRKISRAMFALFANLGLWIGGYDAIDYHLIPAMIPACATGEQLCALVKVTCVVLGLFGLYSTRALYGDKLIKSANFQRMD
jgi:hypothetical protein